MKRPPARAPSARWICVSGCAGIGATGFAGRRSDCGTLVVRRSIRLSLHSRLLLSALETKCLNVLYKSKHATLVRWYSTARVSKRPSHKSTACLRARYCTNLTCSDLNKCQKNLVSKVLSLLSFPKHPLTRLGKLLLEGDSLWSAVARYRFGSHLRTLQASEKRAQWVWLPTFDTEANGLPKRYRATALQRLSPLYFMHAFHITFQVAHSPTAPDSGVQGRRLFVLLLTSSFRTLRRFLFSARFSAWFNARFSARFNAFGMTASVLSSRLTIGIIPVSTLFLVTVLLLMMTASPDLFDSDAEDADSRRAARFEAGVTCAAALVGDPNSNRPFDAGAAQAERLGYAGRCADGNPSLFATVRLLVRRLAGRQRFYQVRAQSIVRPDEDGDVVIALRFNYMAFDLDR